jgi:hypothetical protein
MPHTTSAAAVVVPAPANRHGLRLPLPAVARSPFRGYGLRHGLGRVLWLLGGFAEVLIVAYSFPLVILAVGTPIALLVRLAVESGRALWRL